MYRNTLNSTGMSDWSPQFNYNPSYHAYGYGLVCPPGPEQAHGNLSGWGEAGDDDMSNNNNNINNAGMTQAFYANMPRTQGESSPLDSPEQHGACSYQEVYLGGTEASSLLLTGAQQASEDTGANKARRAGSDSTSDTESRISPDSWSSCSSREISLPQTDPATWAKNGVNSEASKGSPDPSESVSNSCGGQPGTTKEITGKGGTNNEPGTEPEAASTNSSSALPKAKVRVAFSESQMNVLMKRFSVQKYLPPAEMKNLAEMTGMTYKQVKTWFQNRRMKLRRDQQDNTWESERWDSERYISVKGSPMRRPVLNVPSHVPPHQGDARPQLKDHYNQHMMGAAFKKTAPQNLAFYLAAMSSTPGAAGYPTWQSGPTQTAMPNRPQAAGWSMSPGIGQFEYNPRAFNPAGVSANNPGYDGGYEFKDGEPVSSRSNFNPAFVHTMRQ